MRAMTPPCYCYLDLMLPTAYLWLCPDSPEKGQGLPLPSSALINDGLRCTQNVRQGPVVNAAAAAAAAAEWIR